MKSKELKVSTTVVDVVDGSMEKIGQLKYVAKKVIDPGWTKSDHSDKKDDAEGKYFIDAGQHMFQVIDKHIEEKETNPPSAYTEGTLISDMASIAKYCTNKDIKTILTKKDADKKGEHGGIGTTATRGAIIESLKKRGFIENKGKKIVSTKKGQDFYDLIPDEIKTADVTAYWWLIQEAVANGKKDVYAVADDCIRIFNMHKDTAYKNKSLSDKKIKSVGVCPKCGSEVVQVGKLLTCSSNKSEKDSKGSWVEVSGCGFKAFPSVCKKKLTQAQLKKLLSGNRVKVKGLKSKTGKTFEAYVSLDDKPSKSGFYGFSFEFK